VFDVVPPSDPHVSLPDYADISNPSRRLRAIGSDYQRRVWSAVRVKPYKLEQIRIPMRLDELVDVPIYHPLRYHYELVITHCHSQQWQHIRMVKGFPHHNLFAEPLHRSVSSSTCMFRELYKQPTLMILLKSLVEYTLRTLTATLRPWCSPIHTSANPPPYSGISNRL
jgi:hypothetical protein